MNMFGHEERTSFGNEIYNPKLNPLQKDLVKELIVNERSLINQENRDCTAAQGMGHMLTLTKIKELKDQLGI